MRARYGWWAAAWFAALLTLSASGVSSSPVVLILSEWDGAANPTPCLCPVLPELAPSATHEFMVPSLTGSLSVQVQWQADVVHDLDLHVDRYSSATDAWTEVAHSSSGQLLDASTPPSESVVVASPPGGRYRARVTNFLSTRTAYHGEAWFTTTG